MILCPTLLTISASLLEMLTTLLVVKKLLYSCSASDCTSDSGSNLNCLRPVTAFRVQEMKSKEKRKLRMIDFAMADRLREK